VNGVINYTITVQNLGPSDADGAVVSDTIPAGLSAFAWQCTPSGGAACTPTGAGDINDTLTTFPVGSQAIYSITATLVNTDATVVNLATILSPPGVINTAPTNSAINTSAPIGNIFLPLITGNFLSAPDLIIESLIAGSNAVTITIKNIGNAPVVDGFWLDVYINPDTPPTRVNRHWHNLGSQGLVWGVVAPNIVPGESLTLTLNHSAYRPEFSEVVLPLPPGSAVYAQVDSVNLLTDYGGVLEGHEISGESYNNIAATVSILGKPEVVIPAVSAEPALLLSSQLPLR
jgi:uncharacterized repeat protein (TIGR01451 family)